MRSKLAFMIAAAVIVCLVSSIGRGCENFYYGSFHVQALPEKLQEMKDSLRFNLVFGFNAHNYIDALANASLQIVAEQPDDDASPSYWSKRSHYTIWEAEGYPGSNYNLSYNGGTLVNDTSASGGKARRFKGNIGSRLIQWGPSYGQERYLENNPIPYTAEFRLKFISGLYEPPVTRGANPPPPVCSLMVVDTISHIILKDTTLYRRDFTGGVYKTFLLENYTVPETNSIEFQIYLFGTSDAVYLYVDYVKVYDENGWLLVDQHSRDQQIMAYVDSPWVHTTIPETGDTVVYRWYMRDETTYIDLFEPNRYVESLLREVSAERVGFQVFKQVWLWK